jgi:DNA (cytosine-5)-methyltransferase 1
MGMDELSLFTGAGGGLLGSKLLGWRCVGAVEIEEYPCVVLERRQKDGILEAFPIWNMDIREFNRRIAAAYQGMVDVITAGFPCQPFSVAGEGRAENDSRNMWPATRDCIGIIRPRFAFLENVPGLKSKAYFKDVILREITELRYDCIWGIVSARDAGAPHLRKRLWIMANTRK